MWAVNFSNCQGKSWIEVGWTKKGTNPVKYKFIHKTPGSSCAYIEELNFGSPAPWTVHLNKLEYCPSCQGTSWTWHLDGSLKRILNTAGWSYANRLDAGGEVGGHYDGIGMNGAVVYMRYLPLGGIWQNWVYADDTLCNTGYNLIWTDSPSILDWGYDTAGGGCPP